MSFGPAFRLVFTDPSDTTQERPQQILSRNPEDEDTRKWFDSKFASAGPDSFVSIYQTTEVLIGWKRKGKMGTGVLSEPAK